ncbi:MAG: hypothetical protein HC817_00915 [Saprospiraceae bacterium]|nr:hypothetical protein [Saprospiraceae bacterium]
MIVVVPSSKEILRGVFPAVEPTPPSLSEKLNGEVSFVIDVVKFLYPPLICAKTLEQTDKKTKSAQQINLKMPYVVG